ncbi:hypothetical protein JOD64_005263 [Micromonospora luteifusca]|uniref:Predicted membrane protein YciQ-like C-terminal domain-containing protein n=1 Tax=Micromonospora luteifusca TaxID=709860 RepID=A0ABS2M0T6_9ACTN|nr:DUF2207 domain-containing protein [Micromonospora luteifusca]MBM7494041.1 hypothetical protein [Micromonospora luteifusca]
MLELIIAVASVGLWLIAYAGCRIVTRPAAPPVGPATMDLGSESPAVVSMLVNGWSTSVDTAESTVLDLAAAGYYELRQPDADPYRTTVHLARNQPDPSGLRPYERQVLDRIRGLAVDGVVPLTALAFRNENESKAWNSRLRAAVVADARAAGLSERRFGRTMMTALHFGTLAIAVTCGSMAVHHTHRLVAFCFVLPFAAALVGLVQHIGERDTPTGLEAASRWLGVQVWLRNHEQFAELPPSAVAVWDRYLAYGAALGVTRRASDVLDLEVGTRRRLWSSYQGGWRRIRVRYPRGPWRASTTRTLILQAMLFVVAGSIAAAIAGHPSRYSLPGYALITVGVYVLVRALLDLARSEEVTGEVLARRPWRQHNGRPRLDYLVIDDGTTDTTTAWGLPARWSDRCHSGDVVTITARPWSRRVTAVIRRSAAQARPAAAFADEQTGPALRDFFGEVRTAGPLPLSVDDVARLVGQPVRADRRQQPQRVDFRSEADNSLLLRAEWAAGMAGRLAWQTNGRRAATLLPGIGDEAYASGDRAVMRVGDVTLVVVARGRGQIGTPHLPWLLTRCEIAGLIPPK